jgi:hypothetical protein
MVHAGGEAILQDWDLQSASVHIARRIFKKRQYVLIQVNSNDSSVTLSSGATLVRYNVYCLCLLSESSSRMVCVFYLLSVSISKAMEILQLMEQRGIK